MKLSRTMLDNDCNILVNMTKAEYKDFRTLMVDMVLHTGHQSFDIKQIMSSTVDGCVKKILTTRKFSNRELITSFICFLHDFAEGEN